MKKSATAEFPAQEAGGARRTSGFQRMRLLVQCQSPGRAKAMAMVLRANAYNTDRAGAAVSARGAVVQVSIAARDVPGMRSLLNSFSRGIAVSEAMAGKCQESSVKKQR